MNQQVQCKFKIVDWKYLPNSYACVIDSKTIDEYPEIEFIGKHFLKYTNDDVKILYFNECKLTRIPQNLTTTFPIIVALNIYSSNLRNITRDDLKEYKTLKYLYLCDNSICYLPENLFMDLKNLEFLSLSENKFDFVERNILDGLENIKYANFLDCGRIDLQYNSIDPDKNNITLEELKIQLKENFRDSPWKKVFDEIKKNLEIFQDLKNALLKENLRDFKVIVGEEVINVHKIVLSARSPVFAEMFKKNSDAESLNLVDISSDIFQVIHNFMFFNEYPKDEEDINYTHLLIASEKLKIKKISSFAAEKLLREITAINAFELMTLGCKYGYEDLKIKSFNKVKEIFDDDDEIN